MGKKPASKPIAHEKMKELIYEDKYGHYDVPITTHPMWFRLWVRKGEEGSLCNHFKQLANVSKRWKGVLEDAMFFDRPILRFQDNHLCYGFKPLIPGNICVKTVMDPDVADDIESIDGVLNWPKDGDCVVPLSPAEVQSIEEFRCSPKPELSAAAKALQKGGYVTVVSGPFLGRIGELIRVHKDQLEVLLKSENRFNTEYFSPSELRYLATPPEKYARVRTPQEAARSLFARNPNHRIIRELRHRGLLEKLLGDDDSHSDTSPQFSTYEASPRPSRYSFFVSSLETPTNHGVPNGTSQSNGFLPVRDAEEDDLGLADDPERDWELFDFLNSTVLGKQTEQRSAEDERLKSILEVVNDSEAYVNSEEKDRLEVNYHQEDQANQPDHASAVEHELRLLETRMNVTSIYETAEDRWSRGGGDNAKIGSNITRKGSPELFEKTQGSSDSRVASPLVDAEAELTSKSKPKRRRSREEILQEKRLKEEKLAWKREQQIYETSRSVGVHHAICQLSEAFRVLEREERRMQELQEMERASRGDCNDTTPLILVGGDVVAAKRAARNQTNYQVSEDDTHGFHEALLGDIEDS